MQPSISDAKMNELCRNITLQQLPELIHQMRNSSERVLPSRAFCRNFLEGFPNTHVWKASYLSDKSISREGLVESYNTAKKFYAENASNELYTTLLDAGLTLVKYDFAYDTYSVAFNKLRDIPAPPSDVSSLPAELVSSYYEFLGTERHLKCQVDAANTYYTQATTLHATNLSAQLKYANLLSELGESSKVNTTFLRFHCVLHSFSPL
jgi:hypothetical protein